MVLSNGALIHYPDPHPNGADLDVTLTKPQLLELLAGKRPGLEGIHHTGDPGVLARLTGLLDHPDPSFAIVTP